MKTSFYILVLFILPGASGYCQYLKNPSFEGPVGMSLVPPDWTVCDSYSTPDTQPGTNAVNNIPTDGNTFMSMVCRGEPADNAGHAEDCEAEFIKPLLKGKCYKFKVDLCSSKTFVQNVFGDDYFYTNPMILRIYLNSAHCTTVELLYQSGVISNADWETIEFAFTPKQDAKYLYLQSDFAQLPYYFGNVLVDNIRLTDDVIEDFVKLDTTINYGETITLSSSNGIAYNWSPQENLNCTSCPNPVITFSGSSEYTVDITDQNSCHNHKEYFKITVNPFIPNIITPDGDGKNDAFRILGLEPNSSLIISNRQGEVLYHTDNYDNSWNGTYKGSLLAPDTYWYIYKSPSLPEKIVGFVYLKQTR